MPVGAIERRGLRCLFLLALVSFVFGAAGCRAPGSDAPRELVQQAPLRFDAPIVSGPWRDMVRLVPAVLRERQNNSPPPIEIGLGTIGAAEGVHVERSVEALVARGGEFDLLLSADTVVDLWRYNTLVFRAEVESGHSCQVNFQFDPSVAGKHFHLPVTNFEFVTDGTFHEYRVPLPDPVIGGGELLGVSLWMPQASSVRISRLAFEADAPSEAERLACEGHYRDVLYGSQPAWHVNVPENAVFRAHVTYGHRDRDLDPVVVRVALESEDGSRHVVGSKTLEADHRGAWIPMEFGLEAYAGQRVAVRLEVDAPTPWKSSGAVWGEPMIVSRTERTGDEAFPIVLISLDTLRADHLGMYGYARTTSPNLDAWSREAARFDHAIVYEPWTLTSHVTMLTGLHHERHGVNHTQDIGMSTTMLAERLREEGYSTGGFVGHDYWLDPSRGFKRGFDVYGMPYPTLDFEGVDQTVDKAARWLREQMSNRFFLFFHTYEIHSKFVTLGYTVPYAPSDDSHGHFAREIDTPGYPDDPTDPIATDFLLAAEFGHVAVSPAQRAHMIASYDDTIRMVDSEVARLLKTLKSIGAYDNALIIITADHGEEFGEKGHYLHSSLYEGCVRVPLLVKFPQGRFAGASCDRLVTNADLYPTVLEVLGLPPDPALDGISLLKALRGQEPSHERALLAFRPRDDGLRTREWKLIHDFREDRWELYNLVDDPLERNNLVGETPAAFPALQADLVQRLDMRPGWHITLRGGSTQQFVGVEIESSGGVGACVLQRSEYMGLSRDELEVAGDGLRANAAFVLDPGDSDKLYFVGAGKVRARIRDRDGRSVSLRVGNAPAEVSAVHDVMLDLTDDRFLGVPHEDLAESAVARIWYVPGPHADGNSQALTPEDLERIESLGYLAP